MSGDTQGPIPTDEIKGKTLKHCNTEQDIVNLILADQLKAVCLSKQNPLGMTVEYKPLGLQFLMCMKLIALISLEVQQTKNETS